MKFRWLLVVVAGALALFALGGPGWLPSGVPTAMAQTVRKSCAFCKKSIPASATKCPYCGKVLPKAQTKTTRSKAAPPKKTPPPAKETMVSCPSCRAQTPKDKFCKECGEPLDAPPPNKPTRVIPEYSVSQLAWHPRGNVLAAGDELGEAVFFTMPQAERQTPLSGGLGSGVSAMSWSRDGNRLLTTTTDGRVWVHDLYTREQISVSAPSNEIVLVARWSPLQDEKIATLGADGLLRFMDPITGNQIAQHDLGETTAMDWSPDATIATGHASGLVAIRDQYSLAVRKTLREEGGGYAGHLSYSPTGGMLAVGLDPPQLVVFDLNKGTHTTFSLSDTVFTMTWAPEGRRLAVDCMEKVLIFDVWARVKMLELPVTAGAMAWSPDGEFLAITDAEGIGLYAIPPDHLAMPKRSGG